MGLSLDNSYHPIEEIIEYLIIGGGVAGLSTANRLCDLGFSPVVVEAGTYPAHKVCGEFLSPEVLPVLAEWSIVPPCSIRQVDFFVAQKKISFQLPEPAGSFSRYELDTALVQRAESLGARFLCNTKVDHLERHQNNGDQLYLVKLSTGQTLQAKNIFVGSGRVTSQNTSKSTFVPKYFGFKAHFSGIDLPEILQMYSLPGAYLGISNVNKGIANLACLADVAFLPISGTPEEYVQKVLALPEANHIRRILSDGSMVNAKWMTVYAPAFGVREIPDWAHAYFVGEAAGTIPPATGDGLGMAITSGVMAADYAVRRDWQGFKEAWRKRYASRILVGRGLHRILSSPTAASCMMRGCKLFPAVPKRIFLMTRERKE